ncbi:MFS transporter [Rhodococcus triatomae]|uniref:MFS transporter, DHA2 family, multidrug resistance protein n=1 Tax=Rhodococcus triatomae TaxID=300028 RepID=A0A1G8EZQ4_9NOCA|nr:MFS transporter [Rhodococcus triatomae]QNG19339.1 MFS transporter [Rhodococcus triatomae]QNG24748.1 MFS transporter [Rhodococcus triatomae]SDH75317.1 MFS transporter, DHA2 family, multidrug resistance protein [Rhodococcus triatomae]
MSEQTIHRGPRDAAGPREWVGLAVLALPTLVLALDMSVLYLAAPALAADLQPSSTQQLWIIDIYGFMIAGFLITMGSLGDRIGRRRLLMIGALVFVVASIVAAFSTSGAMLIATRALLGIAGATLMPSTLALISNMFAQPRQRTVAISIWISCFMSGMALGPIVGGLLLETFWWGSVFLLAVPVMALLLVTAPLLLPEYRATRAVRLDLPSVVLSLATILPFVYGLKQIAAYGPSTVAVGSMAAAAALAVIFVRRQRILDDPLVDLGLFANRAFTTALLAILISTAAGGGLYLLATQYLQLVEGLSPLAAGLWLIPTGVASVAGALAAPRLAARFSAAGVVAAGLLGAVAGYVMLAAAQPGAGLALVVAGIALVFFGGGPISALGTDLVVGSVPPAKAGSAASMSETGTELGISLGVALLGSLGAAVYRSRIDLPDGLSAEAAGRADDSLTGATEIARDLPAPTASELIDSAQDALTAGLNLAALVAAAVIGILALVTAIMLRERPAHAVASSSHSETDDAR